MACALVVCACGSGAPPTVVTIGGQGFSLGETISYVARLGPYQENPYPSAIIKIYMRSMGGLCRDLASDVQRKNTRMLELLLEDFNTNDFPALTETYQAPGQGAGAYTVGFNVVDTDASCQQTIVARAVTGTVTITTLTNNVADGKFDVTLDSGDHLSASFNSDEACTTIVWGTSPTCI